MPFMVCITGGRLSKKPKFRTGLIVGKFCPLHKGHEFLIDSAIAQCKKLYIISYTNPEFEGCEPKKREAWLRELYPNTEIMVLYKNIPKNDAPDIEHRKFCADLCRDKFKIVPEVIFTSETYGDGFAQYLSDYFTQKVRHIFVGERNNRIISGTKVRTDIHRFKEFLSPVVYRYFVNRVCFLGAESTGKSTLAIECAKLYETTHVDEYGRVLWEKKKGQLLFEDMTLIAKTHVAKENAALLTAKKFLFVDTSPLTTLFYSIALFKKFDPELFHLSHRTYDYIFLCAPDFKLVQDGTRQDEAFRMKQHSWYLKELAARKIQYTLLQGRIEERTEAIKMHLELKMRT